MRARHSLASFLLVLVKHFEKTIINCFFSFTFSVFTLRRTQVRLGFLKYSRNAHSAQPHFISPYFSYILEKTVINCFFFGDG